ERERPGGGPRPQVDEGQKSIALRYHTEGVRERSQSEIFTDAVQGNLAEDDSRRVIEDFVVRIAGRDGSIGEINRDLPVGGRRRIEVIRSRLAGASPIRLQRRRI